MICNNGSVSRDYKKYKIKEEVEEETKEKNDSFVKFQG